MVSTPLKNMKISWHYYPQYMESHKIPWFQTTNQNTDSRGKYGGWLRNLAPVDLWYINIPLLSIIFSALKTIRLVVYRISLAHPQYEREPSTPKSLN